MDKQNDYSHTGQQMTPAEIKQIRKKSGLNAEKFGALIGVGKKTVEAWEQGVRNPSGPAIKILESLKG